MDRIIPKLEANRPPVDFLPSETLSVILDLATQPCFLCYDDKKKCPLAGLMGVCRKWHDVAVNTRSLWSHIHIRINPSYAKESRVPNKACIASWLARPAGVPIHLFLGCFTYSDRERYIVEWLSGLVRARVTSIKSLIIDSGKGAGSIAALLFPRPNEGLLGSLSTLILNDTEVPQQSSDSWSIESLTGLSVLELGYLNHPVPFGFDQLSQAISKCPTLHTLRLKDMLVPRGTSIHAPLHLPQLRLLDVYGLEVESQQQLFSMITPGSCELDLRLDFDNRPPLELERFITSFLRKSKVVSITIRVDSLRHSSWFKLCLLAAPGLPSLVLDMEDYMGWELPQELIALYDCDIPKSLPCFQSLCLAEGDIHAIHRNELEQRISGPKLRTIAFICCSFPPADGDQHNSEYTDLPEEMQTLLNNRAEKVIVIKGSPPKWYEQFMDLQIQGLMRLD
ncbi:pyrolysin [Ceratobasidium sp. AG-Ba]|nr:pyrolysin [Ceratobasidium sp. AG-Ba]